MMHTLNVFNFSILIYSPGMGPEDRVVEDADAGVMRKSRKNTESPGMVNRTRKLL